MDNEQQTMTVAELAERLKAGLIGNGSGLIRAVGPVASADETTLTFLADDRHLAELKNSRAGAVIVAKAVDGLSQPQLVVKNVNAALIEALKIFAPKLQPPVPGVHPTATLGQKIKLGKNTSIGPCVVIEDGSEIGDNTVISAGCKIGQHTKIGANCRLDPNVVIYHRCIIGNNVIIQANSTIGSTGFGYAFIDGAHRLIPHNGTVVIEDFVEIGANCCVDRAKFGETRIGAGTKIDNLVQIAHNVVIGKCCLMAAQVGISGSCKIGDGVVLGGQVGMVDNIEIGDGVVIGAQAGVTNSVRPGKQMLGSPAIEHKDALRVMVGSMRLPKLIGEFKKLSARVEKLETAKDDSKSGGR
ncbi:MAG: UDP-3-O-(3-hydroxymyristoyl)glucosamine N-acyltransferase [Sedimentisphaerales bacterium]|jgi:UDP-3-O-[3-hydroxymyristoyl] glucosamine N-acyltransferase